jgi:hypothetical protein
MAFLLCCFTHENGFEAHCWGEIARQWRVKLSQNNMHLCFPVVKRQFGPLFDIVTWLLHGQTLIGLEDIIMGMKPGATRVTQKRVYICMLEVCLHRSSDHVSASYIPVS